MSYKKEWKGSPRMIIYSFYVREITEDTEQVVSIQVKAKPKNSYVKTKQQKNISQNKTVQHTIRSQYCQHRVILTMMI